jgi:hypothetical protein
LSGGALAMAGNAMMLRRGAGAAGSVATCERTPSSGPGREP